MSTAYQFDGDKIDWTEIDDPSQDYPCKYELSILGADPETLREVNPRLVTCSLTGYGATGPKRDLPAYDYLVQAASGMMSLTGDPDGKPTKYGISIVDLPARMVSRASRFTSSIFARSP